MEHGFAWVSMVPGLSALPPHLATALLVMVLLAIFALWAGRSPPSPTRHPTRASPPATSPGPDRVHQRARRGRDGATPEVCRSSAACSSSSSVTWSTAAGFTPPTDNFNITFGLRVRVFLAYNYCMRAHGAAYLKQFWTPLVLAPLMIIVEGFSHATGRPLAIPPLRQHVRRPPCSVSSPT
jgi:hypothetical protein